MNARRILLAGLIAALLPIGLAQADNQGFPFPFAAVAKSGGTIAVGGTSQTGLAANPGRRGFCIQNPSSETENLYYDLGRAATTANPKSFELTPGSGQCIGGPGTWLGTVTVNAATGGHGFILYEFS